jgi:hypothetical protein
MAILSVLNIGKRMNMVLRVYLITPVGSSIDEKINIQTVKNKTRRSIGSKIFTTN